MRSGGMWECANSCHVRVQDCTGTCSKGTRDPSAPFPLDPYLENQIQPFRGPIGPNFVLYDPAPSCLVPPQAGQQIAASQQIQPVRVIYSSCILQSQVLLARPACSILHTMPVTVLPHSARFSAKTVSPEKEKGKIFTILFRKKRTKRVKQALKGRLGYFHSN
jgi:hypothetical protein